MAESVSDLFLDATTRHQVFLQRHQSSVRNAILKLLTKSEARLLERLLQVDITTLSAARLKVLIQQIREIMDEEYIPIIEHLDNEIKAAAVYEMAWQKEMFDRIMPIVWDMITPSPDAVYAAVNSRPFQGRYLKDWYKGIDEGAFRRIREAIQLGYVEGQTTGQIIRTIRGTRKNGYKDGIFEQSRRGAEAAVRTALNHTANRAREELYKANSEVIKGIQWSSTLDSRTTKICASRDGNVYPIGKGPRPPAHINCRSTIIPITKSWNELGAKGKFKKPNQGQRATMNGRVPADMTYEEWLRIQPLEIQQEVLGVKGQRLWKEGKVPISRFVDNKGAAYTLAELEEREKAVWDLIWPAGPDDDGDGWLDFAHNQEAARQYILDNFDDSDALVGWVNGDSWAPEYKKLQRYLRDGPWEGLSAADAERYDKWSDDIMAVLKPSKDNLIVYRAIDHSLDLSIGDTFSAQGFVSTTLSKNVPFGFVQAADPEIFFEIRLPSGTMIAIPRNPAEREILLGHGQEFKVLDIITDTSMLLKYDKVIERDIRQLVILEAIVPDVDQFAGLNLPAAAKAQLAATMARLNLQPTLVGDLLDMGDTQMPSMMYAINNGVMDPWLLDYITANDNNGTIGVNQVGVPVYTALNNLLRLGVLPDGSDPKYYDQLKWNMDAFLSPLKEGLVLYRGSTRAVEMAVGDVFPAEGYFSTSLWKQTSFMFGLGESGETIETLYEIRTPKGILATISSMPNEREVILNHGQMFKVVDIRKDVEDVFTEGYSGSEPITIRQYITLEALQ